MAQKQVKRRVEPFWKGLLLVALTSLLLHAVPVAHAYEPTPEQPQSFLVLGILSDGRKLDPLLREHLTQLIARKFGIARAPALVDSDLACRAPARPAASAPRQRPAGRTTSQPETSRRRRMIKAP